MSDYSRSKSAAEEVLRENFITKPPIPVTELVKNYGYGVAEMELPSDVAGFVNLEKKVIFVNVSDSENRKAFTIAHELGHIKLHAEELQKNPDIGILYRHPLGRKNSDEKEQEANCFAASLLVPRSMFDQISERYKDVLTKENKIDFMSQIFGVSPEVIGYRMRDFSFEN